MMQLREVVPFGRLLDEYRLMFALSENDLGKGILGVGDGPASFNAEMHELGRRIVSVDPIYDFTAPEIERRFREVVDDIIDQVRATPDRWMWDFHGSPEGLRANRELALTKFVADFESGKSQGRYVVGSLPRLEFLDHTFELALCSHLLFLYSDHLDYDFHRASLHEMLRVADEVRVFPLLTLLQVRSPHLAPLIDDLQVSGFVTHIQNVDYGLQKGDHEMLCVKRRH